MKKLFLALVLFGILTTVFAQDKKSQQRNIGTFNELDAGKGINVTLIEGDKEKLVVEIKNADLSDVITELKGRRLEIKLKTKIYKDVAVQVYVTYKSIKAIKTGTGAFVDANNVIHAENLDLRAGSGSTIILDIDTRTVSSSLSSSKIELAGKTEFQDVKTNTGGKYIANMLTSKQTFVKASTGGTAWVNATEKLEAKTNTGGRVTYNGNPEKLILNGNVEKEE
ncbi:Putative auto-transporter adhesin, head GIN domain [Saccharicrinis carchari]|uniref:Auto-transporter adhesin, head GIN domain n=2 Tax=Saccharicrinis carchari TaxID=1168039 RepID=A0A521AJ47_SACCC|nr:Putative auto-transporter adhesin, head GIN domain [Saccharicrinis carchari]